MNVIETITQYAGASVFLMSIIMALVTYWGKLGVTGKWQLVSSLATGLVIGGGFMWIELAPADAVSWVAVVLYGLLLGLTASGVYEVGKELTAKKS